jgi:hypothetical protein
MLLEIFLDSLTWFWNVRRENDPIPLMQNSKRTILPFTDSLLNHCPAAGF